jgi:hypothetical protein
MVDFDSGRPFATIGCPNRIIRIHDAVGGIERRGSDRPTIANIRVVTQVSPTRTSR